jgi:hypothetical protein
MPADQEEALVAAADELYALAPEEFTNARNARAKAAQADGDRELAAAIRGLAKPSAAAWLANQLVRRDRAALDPLLELGASLRDATARLDGAQMRALSRQQAKLVAGLVRRAGELGTPSGKPVSPGVAQDLDDTLRAAIADADAADQLMAGRLANSLQHNGFGLVAPGNLSLVATSSAPADRDKVPAKSGSAKAGPSAKPSRDERRAEQLAAAEREVDDAQAAVEVTESGQARAADDLETAEQTLGEAKTTLDQLREELERAKFAVSRAEGGLRQAKQSLEQVNRAARAARNGLDDAVARRDRLST